jgi:hypothetical protein
MKASEARALLERKYKDEIDDVMENIYTNIEIAVEFRGDYKLSWWPQKKEELFVCTVVRKLEENGYTVSRVAGAITIYW